MVDFENWSNWSIRPEYLEETLNNPVFIERMKTVTGSIDDIHAITQGDAARKKPYKIIDDVAVIPIAGPLAKRMSFMTWIMGGTTFSALSEMIYQAIDDPEVGAIVLDIDSPGGTVSGTDAFSEVISTAAAIKPVVAFANGCMCSAAYWAASGASMIMAERTASVGSIGVIMVHADFSKMDEKDGIKFTVMKAGKYKAVGNPYEPLSDDDRKILQAELDALYGIFIETVAENRGKTRDQVKDMAEGRVFIGKTAVDVGLVDEIGNLQTAIDTARDLATTAPVKVIGLGPSGPALKNTGLSKLTAVIASVHGEETAARFKAFCEAGGKSVEDFLKLKSMIDEEKPTKELAGKNEILAALRSDRNTGNPGDFLALVDRYQEKHNCSKVEALQYVMKNHPNEHKAYLKAVNQ